MKKFRTIIAILMALAALFSLAACSKEGKKEEEQPPKARDYNVAEIAKGIYENVRFDDEYLVETPAIDRTLCEYYHVDASLIAEKDGAKEAVVYVPSAGPEAIICFKAVDESAANTAMEAIKGRIADDTEGYKTYGPELVPKLETAVEVVKGSYVFVIISADNAAAETYLEGVLK